MLKMAKKQSQSNVVTCVTSWLGDSSCYQGEGNYKGLHNVRYPGVRLTLGPGPAGGDHMWSGRQEPAWAAASSGLEPSQQNRGRGGRSCQLTLDPSIIIIDNTSHQPPLPATALNQNAPIPARRLICECTCAWCGYKKEGSPELGQKGLPLPGTLITWSLQSIILALGKIDLQGVQELVVIEKNLT